MPNRSYWVDYAKAIGIVLVVYGHVARGLYNAGIDMPKKFYILADSIVYSFHMPLFFFLSGLFFYSSLMKRGAPTLVTSKIDTIVYPYIVWSIFQGLIEVFLSRYTNGNVSYADVFSLLWAPRAQFWFLYTLFVAFVLATAIFSIMQKKAVVAVFLLSAVLYVYAPELFPDGFICRSISQNFVFFVFGIVYSLYLKDEYFSGTVVMSVLACFFVVSQFVFHGTFHMHYMDKGFATLLLALVSILFVTSFSLWASSKPNRAITYIGSSSMAIYLIHILAGSGVRVILNKYVGIDSYVVYIALGCIVGVGGPLLALFVIEKLNIKYVFSAPVCKMFLTKISNKNQ